MIEYFDIYDINRNFMGRKEQRDSYTFKNGEYHIVTDVFIFNSENKLLLTQRVPSKKGGLLWEGTGGSVLAGETSIQAICREIKEELGLDVNQEELKMFKQLRRDEIKSPRFKDLWILKKDIEIKDLVLQKEEVMNAKWVSLDEFKNMLNNNEIVGSLDFDVNDFNKAISFLK